MEGQHSVESGLDPIKEFSCILFCHCCAVTALFAPALRLVCVSCFLCFCRFCLFVCLIVCVCLFVCVHFCLLPLPLSLHRAHGGAFHLLSVTALFAPGSRLFFVFFRLVSLCLFGVCVCVFVCVCLFVGCWESRENFLRDIGLRLGIQRNASGRPWERENLLRDIGLRLGIQRNASGRPWERGSSSWETLGSTGKRPRDIVPRGFHWEQPKN